jgi:hypothetical protein
LVAKQAELPYSMVSCQIQEALNYTADEHDNARRIFIAKKVQEANRRTIATRLQMEIN